MTKNTQVASFIGTLPGPRTGMTASTEQIVQQLQAEGDLRVFDIGRVYQKQGLVWRIRKVCRSMFACLKILFWKRRGNESIYLIGNSAGGIYYNIFHARLARCRGFRCVFHHHVYNYIDRFDRRMKWLIKAAGVDCIHVMACQKMVTEFNEMYSTSVQYQICPPRSVASELSLGESTEIRDPRNKTFTIGHLSNLSLAKGLKEVLETFERLKENQVDVKLVLAGPFHTPEAKSLVMDSIQKFSTTVEYRGPVYDEDKARFFQDIDLFLFPSKMESWGIVLNEALAAKVPVCSVDVGCISCLVGNAGVVADAASDFSETFTPIIKNLVANPSELQVLQERAVIRAADLEQQTQSAFKLLIQTIFSSPAPK